MSTSGLWVQTAHDGWLRADQVVQVEHTPSTAEAEHEVRVCVPVRGGDTELTTYVVAYCNNDQQAKVVAFSIMRNLATQAHVAGLLRVRHRRVEVTPFGELDPSELFR